MRLKNQNTHVYKIFIKMHASKRATYKIIKNSVPEFDVVSLKVGFKISKIFVEKMTRRYRIHFKKITQSEDLNRKLAKVSGSRYFYSSCSCRLHLIFVAWIYFHHWPPLISASPFLLHLTRHTDYMRIWSITPYLYKYVYILS